jgi:hypothetical protein
MLPGAQRYSLLDHESCQIARSRDNVSADNQMLVCFLLIVNLISTCVNRNSFRALEEVSRLSLSLSVKCCVSCCWQHLHFNRHFTQWTVATLTVLRLKTGGGGRVYFFAEWETKPCVVSVYTPPQFTAEEPLKILIISICRSPNRSRPFYDLIYE